MEGNEPVAGPMPSDTALYCFDGWNEQMVYRMEGDLDDKNQTGHKHLPSWRAGQV